MTQFWHRLDEWLDEWTPIVFLVGVAILGIVALATFRSPPT